MNKYLELLKCTIRNQLAYIGAYVMNNFFLAVILFIFFNLWQIIFADKSVIAGFTMVQTLWYLAFTEMVELSRPQKLITQTQTQIKDGTIAYTLGRPYSYLLYTFTGAIGEAMVKLLPTAFIGITVTLLLVGPPPMTTWAAVPAGILLLFGGIVLNILWYLIISLLAFWSEEVRPFAWIFQKVVFVFGGLLFPLDFLPSWLQNITRILPFGYQAYWPAKIMVSFNSREFITAAAGQIIYITLLAGICSLIFTSATRRLQVNGG